MVGLAYVLAILVSLTVHEFAHAAVANLYGDSTAKDLGRLSFNPLVHIDGMGAFSFLVFGFGWGKPVPVNSLNFKDQKRGDIMTSIAGPFSNLVLALLFAGMWHLAYPFVGGLNLLTIFLQLSFILNIGLMVFNLIPVPPLDGSHLLLHSIPAQYTQLKIWILTKGPLVLMALVFMSIFIPGLDVFGWIYTIIEWFGKLLNMPVI